MRGRLLAISWAMPPLVYPRAIQVSRSLKELSRRGWSVDVVALDANSDPREKRDEAFAARYSRFYRLHPVDIGAAVARQRRYWKLYLLLQRCFPAIDLVSGAWAKGARAKALALIGSERPQALMTFAQPWSDHLIGLSIKQHMPSLPWVAHFSDPWVDSPYLSSADAASLQRWQRQEEAVIAAADTIVFVNGRTARLVLSKYPAAWRDKVHIVPHGYDPDLLTAIAPPAQRAGRRRLVYTGSMFRGLRDPLKVLEAIVALKTMIPPERMPEVEFVGSGDEYYQRRARELGIDDLTKFRGPTDYLQALQIASEADVFLVIDTSMPESVFFPSKVADYLMFGKPIVALTSQSGATAEILRPLGHACVESEDADVIARAIADTLDRSVRLGAAVEGGSNGAGAYHIARTTDDLEAAIEAAIGKRQSIG